MNELMIINKRNHFFERTINEILNNGFFNSLDSNIGETEENYELEIAVPGMTKSDLILSENDGVLYLKGIKKKNQAVWWKKKHPEFSSTTLCRSFILPENADKTKISAKCENGLLKVSIAKNKLPNPKKVITIAEKGPWVNKEKMVSNKPPSILKKIADKIHRMFK